jgi:hypothetical protein
MNVEETNVMRISRQPSPIRILIDQNQQKNVEYFNYCSTITNDAGCIWEIKSRIAMAKQPSTRRRLFLPGNWT